MLPMRYFRIGAFSAGNLATLLLFASLTSAVFFLAQYLQVSLGYSPLAAGLRFLPWTLTLFLVAPLAGSLADRVGARPLIVAGLALQGLGLAWVAVNAGHDRPYTASIVALVIAGCGTSMAMPATQQAVMGALPPEALGKASGTYGTGRQLGGVIGIAALSALFSARGGYGSPQDFADGAAPALAGSAALALAGAVAGLASRRTAAPAPAPTSTPAPGAPVVAPAEV
jgi:MFS family permease